MVGPRYRVCSRYRVPPCFFCCLDHFAPRTGITYPYQVYGLALLSSGLDKQPYYGAHATHSGPPPARTRPGVPHGPGSPAHLGMTGAAAGNPSSLGGPLGGRDTRPREAGTRGAGTAPTSDRMLTRPGVLPDVREHQPARRLVSAF